MNAHSILWTSPTPLWGRFGNGSAAYSAQDQARPAILRFASDDFMDRMLAMLAADPRQLGDVIARPETWRSPGGDAPDLIERVPLPRLARRLARQRRSEASSTTLTATTHQHDAEENGVSRTLNLKLYQPAHQRHYLVAANLVCGVPGFPDRAVATGGVEKVGYVLRRELVPKGLTAREEFAYVKDSNGARWQRLTLDANSSDPAATLADGEEILPLFPLNFHDDTDHPRRLLAGVIPTGRREEYMTIRPEYVAKPAGSGALTNGSAAPSTAVTAHKEQLKMEVTEPWKNVIRSAHSTAKRMVVPSLPSELRPSDETRRNSVRAANRQAQAQSYLLLLDFADYLAQHVPAVWSAISGSSATATFALPGQQRLWDWLVSTATAETAAQWPIDGVTPAWPTGAVPPFATNLRDALKRIRASGVREGLEAATGTFPAKPGDAAAWPNFVYLLAGIKETSANTYAAAGIHTTLPTTGPDPVAEDMDAIPPAALLAVEAEVQKLDKLVQLVIGAFDPAVTTSAPPIPFAVELRDALKETGNDEGWFVLRCVYMRCDCGPLQPTVLSAASQRFQLAGFFDPDAPARPIRISLPLDTTPAGMRKYSRGTAFMLSDVLCGQVQRAKGLGLIDLVLEVLPWPFHKDLPNSDVGPCERNGTIGMICSLSIPIITICALILLIIFVMLLDLIFKWLPWLIFCFPIPGLKAKK